MNTSTIRTHACTQAAPRALPQAPTPIAAGLILRVASRPPALAVPPVSLLQPEQQASSRSASCQSWAWQSLLSSWCLWEGMRRQRNPRARRWRARRTGRATAATRRSPPTSRRRSRRRRRRRGASASAAARRRASKLHPLWANSPPPCEPSPPLGLSSHCSMSTARPSMPGATRASAARGCRRRSPASPSSRSSALSSRCMRSAASSSRAARRTLSPCLSSSW